ncbi:hypothetical protein [Bradyrhizobium sp. RP6]|uniref:hypothetical protein n=1 Tax=Bradyrhizobium sp. RP6 TaxID=2489596 RepID=UPI000F52C13A|nr:hypothetical protein [Bradyrhizobium sp. RP6]RQH14813.1 hypothetical protein EHH60_06425 [Bradyrhizobium sp. RP6]
MRRQHHECDRRRHGNEQAGAASGIELIGQPADLADHEHIEDNGDRDVGEDREIVAITHHGIADLLGFERGVKVDRADDADRDRTEAESNDGRVKAVH